MKNTFCDGLPWIVIEDGVPNLFNAEGKQIIGTRKMTTESAYNSLTCATVEMLVNLGSSREEMWGEIARMKKEASLRE